MYCLTLLCLFGRTVRPYTGNLHPFLMSRTLYALGHRRLFDMIFLQSLDLRCKIFCLNLTLRVQMGPNVGVSVVNENPDTNI